MMPGPHLDTRWVRQQVEEAKSELRRESERRTAMQGLLDVAPPAKPQAAAATTSTTIPQTYQHPAPAAHSDAALMAEAMRMGHRAASARAEGAQQQQQHHHHTSHPQHTVVSPRITFIEGGRARRETQEADGSMLRGRVADLEKMVAQLAQHALESPPRERQEVAPRAAVPPQGEALQQAALQRAAEAGSLGTTLSLLDVQRRSAVEAGDARAATVLDSCIRAIADVSTPPRAVQPERQVSPPRGTRGGGVATPPPVVLSDPDVFAAHSVYAPGGGQGGGMPDVGHHHHYHHYHHQQQQQQQQHPQHPGVLTVEAAAALLESVERVAQAQRHEVRYPAAGGGGVQGVPAGGTSDAARVAHQLRHARMPENAASSAGAPLDVRGLRGSEAAQFDSVPDYHGDRASDMRLPDPQPHNSRGGVESSRMPESVPGTPSVMPTPVKKASKPASSWAAPPQKRGAEEEAKLKALQRKLSDLEKSAGATGYDSTFAEVQKQLHRASSSRKSTRSRKDTVQPSAVTVTATAASAAADDDVRLHHAPTSDSGTDIDPMYAAIQKQLAAQRKRSKR